MLAEVINHISCFMYFFLGTNIIYSISIDGVEIHSETQTTPTEFEDVEVRFSGRIGRPAYAAIKNFRFGKFVSHL